MHSSFTSGATRKKTAFGLLGGALLLTMLNLTIWLNAAQPAQAQTSGNTINVFCLDFGKTFPEGQTIQAKGLALDKVRGGLSYALSKGYVTSQPYQVQLAMWNLQDSQPFHDLKNQGTTIAQEIVNNAATVPSGDATAIANLTITNIHETSPQSAYGTATIQGNAATNGLPVGFLLPASDGDLSEFGRGSSYCAHRNDHSCCYDDHRRNDHSCCYDHSCSDDHCGNDHCGNDHCGNYSRDHNCRRDDYGCTNHNCRRDNYGCTDDHSCPNHYRRSDDHGCADDYRRTDGNNHS